MFMERENRTVREKNTVFTSPVSSFNYIFFHFFFVLTLKNEV